ncbi:bifunctional lysylphosphatidylglycerol flippase/synthetase MprF, partial [Gordonia paraffinivorans]|uniref:bifunctional lysylphosphatidylglycerol flippase/synthetase MprF n=1 Tax=Gordonia paraffinivorans TaxID=175628 RepID=UPI002432560A
YQHHVGTHLALADPICAPERLPAAVDAFIDLAESAGATPCLFSIGTATSQVLVDRGWRSVQIAEDTIVDLPGLEFKGKPWQHVRSALNKAGKQDISMRTVTLADESFAVRTQVRAISEEWVGDKGLPEMGFTLGSVEEAMDPEVRVALAVDPDGNVHGVLSWLPVYAPGGEVAGWTLDIMRRRTDGFGPVVEYLIASSAVAFKDQGAQFISLSGAPLARTGDFDPEPLDKLLDALGAALEPYYGFRSLHTFKKKFNPRYEPVFLAFRDESDLPRIGLAISRAYLPDATAGQLLKLAASGKE